MIKQIINVDDKWTIVVYYIFDNKYYKDLIHDLQKIVCPQMEVQAICGNMVSGMAMGFTYSNYAIKLSVVGIGKHSNKSEYISTIVHEAEHVKDAMLSYYSVSNEGEPPANTIGYIVKRMYKTFKHFICN